MTSISPSHCELIHAISERKFKKIHQLLKKGVCLNFSVRLPGRSLVQVPYLTYIQGARHDPPNAIFLNILSMHKRFDINLRNTPTDLTALEFAVLDHRVQNVHLLLSAGADPNTVYAPSNSSPMRLVYARFWEDTATCKCLQLMLLSVGANPRHACILWEVKNEVEKWLQCMHIARCCFEDIFENSTLVEELLSFIF